MNEHEEGFVRSFIEKNKQERTAMLLASSKRRKDFLKSLAHFRGLDMRYAKSVSPKVAHTVDEWLRLLRSKGAPERCWVISEELSRDAKEDDLEHALKETIGGAMGTVLSCIPGRLGFFEDEEERRLLER